MGGGKIVKNNLLIGTTFLSLALGAVSCTNETEQLTDSRTAPMSVQVANHIASRGLITTGTLPADDYGIGVTLVNKSDKAPYDGQTGYANNQWKTANGTTWDIVGAANPNLTGTEGVAVAYYPYSSSATTYTAIPVESASQTDYMYSGWSNDLTNASPEATFTMQHALAVIRVKLVASGNYTGDKSASAVTISSDGFMATASLDASTGILSSKDGAGAEHTQENLGLTLDATGKDVDFLVIPADAPADINFIATIGGKQYAVTITPGETLAQGLIHTYTLTLSAAGMKVSTVEVTPWGDGQTGADELKPYNPWNYVANGVYAVSADGKPVLADKADNTCIAMALITDNQKIMISCSWSGKSYYGGNGIDLEIPNYGTEDEAKLDFNGKVNSQHIVRFLSDGGVVGYSTQPMGLNLKEFNNTENNRNKGYFDWYVPAFGQLYEIYNHSLAIDNCYKKISNNSDGLLRVKNRYFWSSTEIDADRAWASYYYNGVYYKSAPKVNSSIAESNSFLIFVRDCV